MMRKFLISRSRRRPFASLRPSSPLQFIAKLLPTRDLLRTHLGKKFYCFGIVFSGKSDSDAARILPPKLPWASAKSTSRIPKTCGGVSSYEMSRRFFAQERRGGARCFRLSLSLGKKTRTFFKKSRKLFYCRLGKDFFSGNSVASGLSGW